jgi:hypothetical protein
MSLRGSSACRRSLRRPHPVGSTSSDRHT